MFIDCLKGQFGFGGITFSSTSLWHVNICKGKIAGTRSKHPIDGWT